MSDNRNDLPAPSAPNFNQRLRETVQTFLGRQGNPLDRVLTLRDLVDIGVLKLRSGFQLKPGAGSSVPLEPGDGVVDTYEPDLTPPPTPSSMTVTPSISHVMIEHEAPLYRQGHGHLRTRVYGKVVNAGEHLPTFADAAEIGQFSGTIYAQPSNPATTWRLWIKWETVDGVLSVDPAGGINGMEAVTGQDVALLLEALSGQITASNLHADLGARIDLIDGPATLPGSISQRIATEQIARANEIQAERQARAAALLTEVQARGNAISSETQSRITADSALQSQINMLSAAGSGDFSELLAAIQEEQTARIDGDTAEATQRTTLAAQVTELVAVDEYDALERDILGHGVNVLNTAERIRATASLTEEQTVRATANEALAQQITTLTATVGANTATLTAEQTARATADEALSSSLQSLTAKVNTNTASITAEQTARAAADSALTTSINYLQAQVNSNAASITSEATARANADSSLSTRIDTLTAAVNTADASLSAAIQSEATARANADSAEAQARETLAARVTGAEGSINTQAVQINNRYTKAETDSAISSASQALSASYQAADAATLTSAKAHADASILSEQTARANADAAVARSVSTLQASAGTGGLVYNGSFANGSAEGWAGLAGVSSTPYGGLPKAYAGIQTTRDINFPNTDASQWMACKPGDEFEVSAWVSAEHASPMYSIGVQYEKTDGRIDNWVPIASTEGPATAKFLRGYWTAPNDVRRLRFWGQIDTPNGTTVSAWGITDVQLRRTDVRTSAIQILAEASDDKIKGLYAQYTVKLDVGGLVSGYGLASTDTASAFGIRADRFWISGPAHVSDQPPPRSSLYLGKAWYDTTYKEVYYVTAINGNQVTWMAGGTPETDAAIAALVSPFVVQATPTTINGVAVPAGVYIKDAYIQNGTITNAKIANAAIDDAKIASLSATKLTAGQLQVGSWIASSNYVAGAQGWAINSDGTAELSNAVVRGTVYATSGEFSGTVKAGATILGGLAASYSSGAGFYGGLESGAYKWRVGSPTGARIQWTGAAIEVYDASNKLTISSGGVDWGSVTGQGRPADGATVGAPAGTYVGDKLAESLVADVLGAVSAASNASSDATAALDLISDISSDSKFTPIERLAARKEWDEIAGEWFGIYASGGNFGLTALQEAYQAATRALGSYLNGAPWISFDVIPAGISEAYLNATTEINSTEFRSKFKDYYTARQALLNAVADVAATRATWPSVTGEGRPADGATVGATFGVNISGQITPSNASTYIANAAIGTAHIADAAINSAKIGSASIMTANIGEAQVNTLQIAGNAVTVPEVATGDSTIAGNGEYQYILGTQITISEPGMVMASFAAKQDFPNGGRRWDVKLYIDGVERFYTYGGIANDSISMAGALYISTAKTVNISVYWKGADEYCYVKNRCLWAMGAKR